MTPDLVQALAAGATVITPNRRLALYLKSEYDAAQARSGKSVWPSADALPYGAFLERTWQEMADIGYLLTLAGTDHREAREYFVKANLLERWEELARGL